MADKQAEEVTNPTESGVLNFIVDFPGLARNIMRDYATIVGVGAAMGLALTLDYLGQLANIALKENHAEILDILEKIGVLVIEDEDD